MTIFLLFVDVFLSASRRSNNTANNIIEQYEDEQPKLYCACCSFISFFSINSLLLKWLQEWKVFCYSANGAFVLVGVASSCLQSPGRRLCWWLYLNVCSVGSLIHRLAVDVTFPSSYFGVCVCVLWLCAQCWCECNSSALSSFLLDYGPYRPFTHRQITTKCIH